MSSYIGKSLKYLQCLIVAYDKQSSSQFYQPKPLYSKYTTIFILASLRSLTICNIDSHCFSLKASLLLLKILQTSYLMKSYRLLQEFILQQSTIMAWSSFTLLRQTKLVMQFHPQHCIASHFLGGHVHRKALFSTCSVILTSFCI